MEPTVRLVQALHVKFNVRYSVLTIMCVTGIVIQYIYFVEMLDKGASSVAPIEPSRLCVLYVVYY